MAMRKRVSHACCTFELGFDQIGDAGVQGEGMTERRKE
jgi:hypothetical protein